MMGSLLTLARLQLLAMRDSMPFKFREFVKSVRVADISVRGSAIFSIAILPLIFFNSVAYYSGSPLPLVNFDFVFVSMVVGLVPRRCFWAIIFFILLFLFTILLALGNSLSYIFLFDLQQIFVFLSFVADWPRGLILIGGFALVSYACASVILSIRLKSVRVPLWILLVTSAPLIGFDIASGHNFLYSAQVVSGVNVVTSQFYPFFKSIVEHRVQLTPPSSIEVLGVPSYRRLLSTSRHLSTQSEYILSIGFESLGLPLERFNRDAMLNIFSKYLYKHRIVSVSDEIFRGGTRAGELRALCHLREDGPIDFHDKKSREMTRDCIPRALQGDNWFTAAIHGNTGSFYGRNILYPEMGFGSVYFFKDIIAHVDRRQCNYTFTSICDHDAAYFFTDLAQRNLNKPTFLHFMTIGTHFPLPSELTDRSDFLCSGLMTADICQYYKAIDANVREIASAINSGNRLPSTIVIWGDHAPPFLSGANKNSFSRERVPVITLSLSDN